MENLVRVIDIGGSGFRRADVVGKEIVGDIVSSSGFGKTSHLVEFVKEELDPEAKGIGFAVAGIIEDNNKIVRCPNNPLIEGLALKDLIRKETGKPAIVSNDMEGAVTGMAVLLPEEKYFMGITWSSGIGLRVWKNDEILSVSEGGHMILDISPFAPLCGCNKRGHAESLIGGHAVKRLVISELQRLGIDLPKDKHPCRFMDEAYLSRESWAVDFYRMIGQAMGVFLANIQSLLCLPLIVWKGTFAVNALKELESIIRAKMTEVMIEPSWALQNNLRFQMTPGPNDRDAFIGAAAILLKSLKE